MPGVFAALQLLRTLVAAQRWEEAKTTGHEWLGDRWVFSGCSKKMSGWNFKSSRMDLNMNAFFCVRGVLCCGVLVGFCVQACETD